MFYKILCVILSVAFWVSLIPMDAVGLDYPTREIKFIAASSPGSNTDNIARLAAKFGEKYAGKPMVVVNVVGGAMSKGFMAIAIAKPDGYTIGLISNSVIAHPYILKGTTYHYKKNFRVVSQVDYSAQGLIVKKGSPYDIPLKEFVKKTKANPETIKCGLASIGTVQDFARAIFEEEADIKFIKVHFRGAEPMTALLGGHMDIAFGPAAEWGHLYKGGEVNVLAVSTSERDPRFPSIPTFKELGYDLILTTYHWVAVPADTPEPIVNFLAEVFKKSCSEQAFKDAANNLGATAAWEGPEGSMKTMEKVDELYQRVVKKYDIKPQ